MPGSRPLLRTAVLACLLSSATAFHLRAQQHEWTPQRTFRSFNKAEWRGLPQSSIVAMAQDSDGVLWIGTLDGVASFDGRSIDPVAAVDGAPQRGIIAAIVARKNGGVYVASPAGVHIWDRRTWHLVPTKRGPASIAESPQGELWLTDTDGALWQLDGTKWKKRDLPERVNSIGFASDGTMWATTAIGALRIDRDDVEPVGGDPLPGRPSAMVVARDGKVWVATQAGTVHWTSGIGDPWHRAEFEPWPRNAFRCIAEDRRGRIWAGSFAGGVAFGTADSPWTVWNATHGPFSGAVMSILGDREGSVWFGFNAVGLAQWVGEEWSHRTAVDPYTQTRQLFSGFGMMRGQDEGSILVALFGSGFMKLSPGGFDHFDVDDGITEDVRTVAEPSAGKYYVGTRFGIFESEPGGRFKQVLKLANGFVMGLFRSPDGRWYAGSTTEGIFVRGDDGKWKHATELNDALENRHVRDMKWLSNGELWVATLRGVTIYRPGSKPLTLSSKNIPFPEAVNAILEVSNDEMWVGGTGGIAIRREGRWTAYSDRDGVPGQTVYSLALASDGSIWAGGSSGIGRFRDGAWKVWDSRSGLIQEECNLGSLILEPNGTAYVGTMGGIARFDPTVQTLSSPRLKLHWRTTPPLDASGIAQLPHGERALQLQWRAPWLRPQGVQYRSRIAGLRDAWSEPSADDRLNIENLGPGNWRVEVQARPEGESAWSEPLSLSVAVPPFWYETWPARVAIVAALAAIAYAVFRLRIRALRRHAAALEEQVRARTTELAEKVEQLQESEQRALAASKAKSAFLANMSHELRTPLNAVLGFAQIMARRTQRDTEDRESLAVIMKGGEHLLGLINDVLSLSKIEAGRVSLDVAPFDLRVMLRDLEDVMRFRAEEKNLRLVFLADDERFPPAVLGDEGRLRQIILNLLSNAVKFSSEGSVVLRASWSDGRASFEVEDRGPGIAPEDLQRLFEPFVQTEAGQKLREGTGLGLALSRDLARLMGGDISVESTVGKGSTFRVSVLLEETTAQALGPVSDHRRVVALAPGETPPRILVVDDLAVNRAVLSRLLTPVGFQVREAASGEDALTIWESWRPDLIWMDKRMHGIDGLEATRRIRAAEQQTGRARTKIIALSASALEHERGEILAAGCDDFVAKPYRESTIFAKIRDFLKIRYVYEEPAAHSGANGAQARLPVSRRTDSSARPNVAPSILLVDDEWISREVAREILRTGGANVTSASSGQEALAFLETSTFDLVLMDLQMPGMSGAETAKAIRASAMHARVPIIAMSADSFDGERDRLTALGMDDAVDKPVEPTALAAVLDRWLRP